MRGFWEPYRVLWHSYCFFPASILRMLSQSETRRVSLCSQSVVKVAFYYDQFPLFPKVILYH